MAKAAYRIVFVRHGESLWNVKGVFTGMYNIGLTNKGIEQAKDSGKFLKKKHYNFDLAFVSLLTRSIDTLNIILKESGLDFVPVIKDWRLNERHYGDLQGRLKGVILKKYGLAQFTDWRRSYSHRPPKILKNNPTYLAMKNDLRYKGIKLPETECLADVVKRVEDFWTTTLAPEIKSGKKIIVSAHGNSIRAVVKYLENTPEDEIVNLNIPTGIPMVYELDKNLKPIKRYYLGSAKKIKELEKLAAGLGEKK
jgi:2,3-bisphosphoglycerate-dependent phosphoglycerate mutase